MSLAIDYAALGEAVYETIAAAATRMPADIATALEAAYEKEQGAASKAALGFIVENNLLAKQARTPICQDTGYPTFYVSLPEGWVREKVLQAIHAQLPRATSEALLRPNSVHIITGKNAGNNLGDLYPAVYFQEAAGDELTLTLLLKGGGSENVSTQYKLPMADIGAGRDLNGVRKAVLKAVFEAQGFGCAPGILGVAIGADRAQGYALAKKQLLRPLADRADEPALAELEETLLREANELQIGAMGFGGATTVLGVKVAAAHRHPASYFVTIAYGCWALRRKTLRYRATGYEITD
jgi:fumarate hydratase class I